MEEVVPAELDVGERKHVLVTHDECTFYSNDTKTEMWLEEGESIIRKKGQGKRDLKAHSPESFANIFFI